ncbi:MAG: GNAT family N-acetyltransferase [Acidimicrobiia bacterium]
MASADIVVAPIHRRKGIGTALMQQAESWAYYHGADGVILDMLRANEAALAFYRSLGYDDLGALMLKRRSEP